MILSSLSFALMGMMVKYTEGAHLFQKVLFRNLVMLFLILFPMLKSRPWRREDGWRVFTGRRENRIYLFFRAFIGQAGVFLYFYAVVNLNLADSAMLNRLSPFFVTLCAVIFLKEKLPRYQIPALVAAFVGVLLVIKPQFDLRVMPALSGLASAMTAGAAYSLVNYLGGREEADTVIFWFALVATITALLPAIIWWQPLGAGQWLGLLVMGVFAAGGQYFLTLGYQRAPAAEISIYNYTHVLFSGLLGWIVFGEVPDLLSVLGGGIIIAVALFLFWKSRTAAVSQL